MGILAGLRMDLGLTTTLAWDWALALTLTGSDDRTRTIGPLTGAGTGAMTLAGLRAAATAAALAMAARWAGVCLTGVGKATIDRVSKQRD